MHAAAVVEIRRRLYLRHIINVPGILRLMIIPRAAHAADDLDILSEKPFRILIRIIHPFTDISLDIADRLIDRAIVVHVGVIGHNGACHTVCEFMSEHVQALTEFIG